MKAMARYKYVNGLPYEWCSKHKVWVPLNKMCEFCFAKKPKADDE